MVKPLLYYATLSPPSRAVLLTAKEIGLELDLHAINLLKGEHLTPEFIKMNPQHTIPTLDDNGVIIYDSHAICSYLVEKYGKNDKLYPKDLIKRSQVDARLHFDSGHLFARLRFLYEPILYYGSTDCSIDKIAYIQKCYDIMEGFLKEHDYLCGDDLTIADFCCIATITSVNEVAPMDSSKYPKVVAWMERLSKLPYYKESNQDGADELKSLFKEILANNKAKTSH
ncbi:glutathione S-transferase 1-like [Condylostylus longicornis]|uniref:glutathione S-transferase 1-like n=1 Tax=Condylostylus longicornis TaxID=2530218 RepID=UPI00244E331D|nr:glutathione S-transferase 1-like [Condylostylus longicornis]XP_055373210.1 glutathione S-transferase 1-like [Condylostylus longicornis]